MLKINQRVKIAHRPTHGAGVFNDDYLGRDTYVIGMLQVDDKVMYQLSGYDTACLWLEECLGAGDHMNIKEPLFNLGDEVIVHNEDGSDTVHTVGAMYIGSRGYQYIFEDEGLTDKKYAVGESEDDLTLYRRKLKYTLF